MGDLHPGTGACRSKTGLPIAAALPECCASFPIALNGAELAWINIPPLDSATVGFYDTHALAAYPTPLPVVAPFVGVPSNVFVGWGYGTDGAPVYIVFKESDDGVLWTNGRFAWLPPVVVTVGANPQSFEFVSRARYVLIKVFNPNSGTGTHCALTIWNKQETGQGSAHNVDRFREFMWDSDHVNLGPTLSDYSPVFYHGDATTPQSPGIPASSVIPVGTGIADVYIRTTAPQPGGKPTLRLLGDMTPSMATEDIVFAVQIPAAGTYTMAQILKIATGDPGCTPFTVPFPYWRVQIENPDLADTLLYRCAVRAGGI